jgi:hypothetical protein
MKENKPKEKKRSRMLIGKLVTKFEKTGTICDIRHSNPRRPPISRTDDFIGEVETLVTETPQKSVRHVYKN